MSGLFGGGGQTISTSSPMLGALRVQTSAFGMAIPAVWGKTRIPGNLIWYADFKAIPHTTTTSSGGGGGKGGGEVTSSNTTYTYQTAVAIGLCEGPINGIGAAWAGKSQNALGDLGLTAFLGSYPQAPWGYLETYHPQQAIGYQGIAYVAGASYNLGDSADLPNHTFEVLARAPFNAGAGIDDANPKDFLTELLTAEHFGAGFPSAKLGDLTQYSDYCVALGLFLSPALAEQKPAQEYVAELARLTNAEPVWSEGVLKMVPYGDEAVTGNGATFTPNVTPIYDLSDDDFQAPEGEDPVRLVRKTQADAFNRVQVEFLDRANQYNVDIAEAKDQANIELYGLRPMDPIKAHWICEREVADLVAWLILQRALYVRNEYEFELPFNYDLLEPMDLVTLTDPGLGLDLTPVRIKSIDDDADEILKIVAEEFPTGVATASRYPSQAGIGYSTNYNIAAGNINVPVIFEPPQSLTESKQLEAWIAVSGGAEWSGCEVWVSDDDATYRRVGTVYGSARHGTLTAALPSGADPDATNTLAVDLGVSRGELISGTRDDADRLNTLCYVDGEYLAYETATLTSINHYNLSYLRRGAYGSAIGAHAVGAKFVRLDDSLFKQIVPLSRIGSVLYFKFLSFNRYGGGKQNLADVEAYAYLITGYGLKSSPSDVPWLAINDRTLTWGTVSDVDLDGYRLRWLPSGSTDWGQAQPMHAGLLTYNAFTPEMLPSGDVAILIKAVDTSGNESKNATAVIGALPDPVVANVIETIDLHGDGFPGLVSGATLVAGDLLANAAGTMWNPNAAARWWSEGDSDLMWNLAYYSALTYIATVTTPAGAVGSQVTLTRDTIAEAVSLDWRAPAGDAAPMWGDAETLMWSGDDAATMRANAPGYVPWPGTITAEAGDMQIRVRTNFSRTRGRINALTLNYDVPDRSISLDNVAVSSSGSTLAIGSGWHAVTVVNLTLQDDGGSARVPIVINKSTSGPLVKCLDASGVAVSGTVDAIIQGY